MDDVIHAKQCRCPDCQQIIRRGNMTFEEAEADMVNHPPHYTNHPSGVECITITECFNFCIGNAIKYLWRCDEKHDSPIEDLKKARFYIDREIKRLEK